MKKSAALDILGLSEGASDDEIKAAHRKLIIAHHPDKFPLDSSERSEAEELTKQINESRDVLLNRSWTPEFDPRRDAGPYASGSPRPGAYDPFTGQPYTGQRQGQTTYVWSWDDIRGSSGQGGSTYDPFAPFREQAQRKTAEEIKAEALEALKREGSVVALKVAVLAVMSLMGLFPMGLFAYVIISFVYALWKSMKGCLIFFLAPLALFVGWTGFSFMMQPTGVSMGLMLAALLSVYYDVKTIRDLVRLYN